MTGFDLKSFDELFGINADSSSYLEISLEEIDDFPNHPFRVIDNDDMLQLVDSIKENGVINPAIVREKADGRYELISGHRRKRACELAGLSKLKCAVREITDDEATIFMVDSNFQRSSLLPSEKAFAYKMRMEAMKHQGKRSDTTSTPMGSKSRSNEKLAKEVGESREQIRRYIRLTELIPSLLDYVDTGKLKLRAAVEISYISKTQQDLLCDFIADEEIFPSESQAKELKGYASVDNLTEDTIAEILIKEKSSKKKELKIPISNIEAFFPNGFTEEQMLNEIYKLLSERKEL